jgi:hypothetical protein
VSNSHIHGRPLRAKRASSDVVPVDTVLFRGRGAHSNVFLGAWAHSFMNFNMMDIAESDQVRRSILAPVFVQ